MDKFSIRLIAVILIAWMLREGCNCMHIGGLEDQLKECKDDKPIFSPVEVTSVDSVPVFIPIEKNVPVPYAYIPAGYVKATEVDVPDPQVEYKEVPVNNYDSAWVAWLVRVKDDYFSQFFFGDTIRTAYGNIYRKYSTKQNRLTIDSGRVDLKLPHTTTTITQQEQAKKKVKGYLVGSLQGSPLDPFQSFGGGFMLQFKNDNGIELQKIWTRHQLPGLNQQPWQVSYKQKISFK